MKIFVIHDSAGNLLSAAAPSEQARGQASLLPGEGQQLSEVELGEVALPQAQTRDPEADELTARIEQVLLTHRVREGKLVPRG